MSKMVYRNKLLSNMLLVFLLAFFFLIMSSVKVGASSYAPGGVDIQVIFNASQLLRSGELFIEKDNQFDNGCDLIDLANYNLDSSALYAFGYRTLVIVVQFDMKEKNDGWQRFYMYNNSSSSSQQLVGFIEMDYYGNTTKNIYTRSEYYAEIRLEDIMLNKIYLRYGARGAFQNDWYNRNVEVQLAASTETRKINIIKMM